MALEVVRAQLDYNEWVNHRLLAVVEQVPAERTREQFGGSFDTIHGTVAHILGAEHHYFSRWTSTQAPPRRDDAPIEELRAQWEALLPKRAEYLRGLTEEQVVVPLHYATRSGASYDLPLWQLMLQMVNHGTHHRAELCDMLTRVGCPPPGTDIIVYFQDRAGPSAPTA
ncbi:MAG: DinB family protein [Chloroflexi bacterium]|nr:DinB family protein [Chloroflexota bacterium]